MDELHFKDPAEVEVVREPEVKEIVSWIDDKSEIIDDQFVAVCDEVLDLINNERVAQGRPSYDHDQRIVLVYELYRTALKYKEKKRKDGESTFYSHLIGALKYLVTDQGLTSLTSMLAIMKHDWVEDFVDKGIDVAELKGQEELLYAELCDPEMYRGRLDNYSEEKANIIQSEVSILVRGVTKLRKFKREEEDRGATRDATFLRFLRVAREYPRVVSIKLADRTHNIETIDGHGDDIKAAEKKLEIMRETESIYLGVARIFHLRQTVRRLVDQCVGFLNPLLKNRFEEILQKRLKDRLEPKLDSILEIFFPSDGEERAGVLNKIRDVQIVLRRLEDYTVDLPESFEDITISDLRIEDLDPMFEILVLTSPNGDFGGEGVEKARWNAMSDVKFFIGRQFASDKGALFDTQNPSEDELVRFLGIPIHIFSREFGGHLDFRVNDVKMERISKRGVMANALETPERLKEMIKAIVNKSLQRKTGIGTKDTVLAAQRELMAPRICVFTPKVERIVLPKGSTGLDFAAALHGELLIGLQKLKVRDRSKSRGGEGEISPFDPLDDGKQYIIDSCLSGENYDFNLIKVNPSWLLFCHSYAGAQIRRFLRGRSPEMKEGVGRAYVEILSGIFNVSVEEIFKFLNARYPIRSEKDVASMIGEGKINPLIVMADYVERDKKKGMKVLEEEAERVGEGGNAILRIEKELNRWEIKITLPNRPGALDEFSREFSKEVAISIDWIEGPDIKGDKAFLRMVFNLNDSNASIYDFFVKLLKLNSMYNVQLMRPLKGRYSDNRSAVDEWRGKLDEYFEKRKKR